MGLNVVSTVGECIDKMGGRRLPYDPNAIESEEMAVFRSLAVDQRLSGVSEQRKQ